MYDLFFFGSRFQGSGLGLRIQSQGWGLRVEGQGSGSEVEGEGYTQSVFPPQTEDRGSQKLSSEFWWW